MLEATGSNYMHIIYYRWEKFLGSVGHGAKNAKRRRFDITKPAQIGTRLITLAKLGLFFFLFIQGSLNILLCIEDTNDWWRSVWESYPLFSCQQNDTCMKLVCGRSFQRFAVRTRRQMEELKKMAAERSERMAQQIRNLSSDWCLECLQYNAQEP